MHFAALNRVSLWRWLPIILLLAGCGGLAGEPQIVATLPPAAPQRVVFPAAAPDLWLGAQIYAANCTRCHGTAGRGDGPLVGTGEGQINPPPPDFTNSATTQNQTPQDWFGTITNGRLERLMPPWRDALSDQERWAVAMYTWAMHYPPELIAAGQQLWAAQTAETPLPSQEELAQLTDDALLARVAETAGAADYVASLAENDRLALAAYLRSSALANTGVIGTPLAEVAQAATPQAQETAQLVRPVTTPETTAEATAENILGTISGTVSNGTAGASVPPDLKITLRVFDLTSGSERIEDTRETTASPDGTYSFSDINLQVGRAYDAFSIYQDRAFGNSTILESVSNASLNLPITIYERTDDPSVIKLTALVTQLVASGSTLQVAQVFSFTNTSDRVFSTQDAFGQNSVGETRYGSLRVSVPAGSQLSGFADTQERYVIAEDGSSVTDTAPVLPGEGHILHLLYTMPYTGELQVVQPLAYAVEGPVRLLITPSTLAVTSPQLPSIGPQTLRNITYQGYGGDLVLPADDAIRYQVSGQPGTGGSSAAGVISGGPLVAVLLVGVGLAIIGVGVYVYLRGRRRVPAPAAAPAKGGTSLIDGLVQQIAELDDAHAGGDIDDTTYRKRRKRLKSRLAELMDQE